MIPALQKEKFTKEEIIEQKNKICSSTELSTKSTLCRLLNYLVKETLVGREEKLIGYTIGVELFKKGEDFDAEQNPLVRIHAGRLRRMLTMYYLQTGKNDPIRIEIAKGQYVPHFFANNYSDISEPEKKLNFENLIKPTVAILPFGNLSGDPAKNYFSLGFSEELSIELTKFEDLVVFESMSLLGESVSDPNKHKDILKKGIRFIVEGGVHLTDDRIKVLVKLTDMSNSEQIWAERYLRDLSASNLIDIQEDIVSEISGILGSAYGIILQKLSNETNLVEVQNLNTFHAISRFHFFEAHQTIESAKEAFTSLEKAVSIDPKSGKVHAMLASLYGNRYMLDYPDADNALNKMIYLAEKALDLNPNNLTVRVINAWKNFICNDKTRYLEEADWCLSKNMHPSVRLGALGFHLTLFGEWEKGKKILDKVMNSNISFPKYYYGATMLYYYRDKKYEKALAEAKKYDVPALFWGPMLRIAVMGQLNKASEINVNIEHLLRLKPEFEKKAQYLISRFVKEDDLTDHIIEGLQKAGMQV